jgi:hypothetical protein
MYSESFEQEEEEEKQPPKPPPTKEELMAPTSAEEIVMYVKDPTTGEYTPHIIAKAVKPASQVNANDGGVVNVNPSADHYDDSDGKVMIYFKLAIPALFSFLIISLCCFKIVYDEQTAPELRAVYWSTLTATATSWLPSAAAIKRRG